MIAYLFFGSLFAAFWSNLIARSMAAPDWILKWRERGKPWSCTTCMSFWTAFAFVMLSIQLWARDLGALTGWDTVPRNAHFLFMRDTDILVGFVLTLIWTPVLTSAMAFLSLLWVQLLDKLELTIINK